MRLKSDFCCHDALVLMGVAAALLPILCPAAASSQTVAFVHDETASGFPSAKFSSSLTPAADLPEAPTPLAAASATMQALPAADREPRPFHSLAVGLTLGTGGIGVELATPINTKFNLRGGASFFGYGTSFVVDTIPIDGTLHLTNVHTTLDWFPRARSFHISPGITFYDKTRFDALIFVPGGQVIQFNDQNYTSDPNDPIHGDAHFRFGSNFAPRLTLGYGNVIRHNTPHFTFPVEVGFEYIRKPSATFNLSGSSCDSTGDCGPIDNDPETQQNIAEQQNQINQEVQPFRFFPILSVGISYKFGH